MVRRDRESRNAAGCLLRALLVVGLLVIAVALFATFYTGATPKVLVESALPGIGRRTPIQVRIDDPQRVRKVRIEVVQETVQGLRTGEAIIRVTAERAGSLLRTPDPVTAEIKLPVRLAPPTLQIASTFHYINQGGCET